MNEKEKLQGKRAGFSPEDTGIEAKADRKGLSETTELCSQEEISVRESCYKSEL